MSYPRKRRTQFQTPPLKEPVAMRNVPWDEREIVDDLRDGIMSSWTGLDDNPRTQASGRMRRPRGSSDDQAVTDQFPDEPPFGYAEPELFE